MVELKSIFKTMPEIREEIEYGQIRLKLKEYLDRNNINRNQVSTAIGVKFQTIDRYYKTEFPEKVDCLLLAKICYALDCSLDDIMEYTKPIK